MEKPQKQPKVPNLAIAPLLKMKRSLFIPPPHHAGNAPHRQSYKMTNPNHPKIGVTHTPTIGLSHTPSTGVSQTDFEATGKYHLNNLNRPLKTTKTTVFTPLPPLHATHTRIHHHRAPVSTTFLHSCLPRPVTRINLSLSPVSTSGCHSSSPSK